MPDRYHHGDLREALIDAALRALDAGTVETLTLRRLAQDAGVSHAAPYHHFPDLNALLAAVAARGFVVLREAMAAGATEAAPEPFRRLQAAGTAYVTFAVTRPELFRLMFSGRWKDTSRHPELKEAEEKAFADLQHMMHGAMGSRTDSDESTARPAAVAAWATVHGVATLLVDGRIELPPGLEPTEAAQRLALEVTTVLGRGLRSL
jgi:AcrR family transcriptional regulator